MGKYKYHPRVFKKPSSKLATFPLKNKNDINLILNYFLQKKESATTEKKEYKAYRNYILCLLGFNTAFRIEDLLQIYVIDVSRGFVSIKENKTKKSQVFRLNKTLYEELMKYIEHYELVDHDYLFAAKPHGARPITRQRVDDIFKVVAKDVQLHRPFSAHCMRKTFAYNKYIETSDIYLVMRLLNHVEPGVTLAYICWDTNDTENERERTYFGLSN